MLILKRLLYLRPERYPYSCYTLYQVSGIARHIYVHTKYLVRYHGSDCQIRSLFDFCTALLRGSHHQGGLLGKDAAWIYRMRVFSYVVYVFPPICFIKYSKDVSREFDEFQVITHLCKLRCWYPSITRLLCI